MDEIKIVTDLLNSYKDSSSLNEAETRFKIIDIIVEDILKWPKSSITVEKHVEGNFVDYILSANNKPKLIIESKREGKYFEVPETKKSSFEKIQVDKLLSDENIKKAIFQVKEYAEDLLCDYAAICNGHAWIIFRITSLHSKPWKKLPAYVIKNLSYFKEHYSKAINLLSYHSITVNNSLKETIGVQRSTSSEIYFPKNSIIAYDTPVNSNSYAHVFNVLSRRYLGNIPIQDHEFYKLCYVTNKGHYDDLQKNITGHIFDSLTPYYRNLGFKSFSDDKKGGGFAIRIEKIIEEENLNTVMILFGGRGSGKSTFIRRLLFHVKPKNIVRISHIALVDLLDAPQSREQLNTEIWKKLMGEIDPENILKSGKYNLIELFREEYDIFYSQFLEGLKRDSIEYNRLELQFLKEKLSDIKYCCKKLSRFLKNKNNGLIVFLDNMDQLAPEMQDICFLNAFEISKKLGALVIISMREERFYDAKMRGALDAYHTPGFHITSPVIPDVIVKRVRYIKKKMHESKDPNLDFNITEDKFFHRVHDFLSVCEREMNRKNSALSTFLRYSTQGDVRQALEFFKGFLTSGYTNINEMTAVSGWKFQIHQVVKPMMIPDRLFYDEKTSKIPNLFQLRNETFSSHFSGIRILQKLKNLGKEKVSGGFIDVRFLIQSFENTYGLGEDCKKHLSLFLNRGLVESNNRVEEYSDKVDQIRITSFGLHILDSLAFDFTYLDLVSLDCGLFDQQLHNYFIEKATAEIEYYHNRDFHSRIHSRLDRVEKFIEYLAEQEQQEVQELKIEHSEPKFSEKIIDTFKEQRKRILRSANAKRNRWLDSLHSS